MKGRFINYFFLFVFSTLLFILERGEMFKRFASDEDSSFAALSYIIVAMIALSGFYILVNKRYLLHTKLLIRYTTTMIVIYVLTIIWSLFYPLSSRNVYGYFLLPVFVFAFMNVITRLIDKQSIIVHTLYVVGVLCAAYYLFNYTNNTYYDVERQSNTSYTVLYFFPIMLCTPKKWLRYVAIGLVVLIVMLSLKRGGFVAVLFAVAVYLYISQISLKGKRLKIWGMIVFLVLCAVAYLAVIRINSVLLGNMMFDRLSLIEETGGSGRESIYRDVLNLIASSRPVNFLFGHGWCATERDSFFHLTAHNDFLEILYDFGIIAFVLYIMVIVELFKLAKVLIKHKSDYAPALGSSIAIFIVNSMVSHIWIYCQYLLIFAVFWGVVSAVDQRK